MPDELNLAEIQQAFFEYRANFAEPIFAYWFERRHGDIVNALHKALTPWHVGLENISWNQAPKNAGEIQLIFDVPPQSARIQVGIGGVTMSVLNPDWSCAPELISLFQSCLETLRNSTNQGLQSQLTTLGLHLRPMEGRLFKEVVGRFVNAGALGAADASMYGVSVYSDDYSFVIDSSGVVAGGVFIKLIRSFAPQKRFEEMAKTIRKDEETVLRYLGLRLQ
jgi:hypothetical protein